MEKTTNKVELIGFIGIDPETKKMDSGKSCTRFSLATNESYKDKSGAWVKDTTWHNVIIWNNKENSTAEELKKGNRVLVVGKLKNRQYKDKLGAVKYISEVVAQKLELIVAE